ncbi:methyltransferase domain-containing protein [Rhizobium sp. KVB221]|uniref:Methyltransferase domain-containing protein n=1 Tax=Rhizobium setariae TaxID=2801340 RepID=A0A937CRM1_9HYPH|nr:methyltransferase domain-containing protein [Rhizobium setariae]MBL0374857.1 methyltransferase domain-containing protein [Rhizobium setariae]
MAKKKKIEEKALADAYNEALALEKAGKREEAANAYRKVLELDPEDHGGAAVRIASMGLGEVPPKAPDAYVATLFDQHAEAFESILVDQLEYCVPLLVRQRIQALGLGPFKKLLDLGCGTGLTGGALRDIVDDITGLDISENMVEIAHEKDLYETLYVAEAADYLEDNDDGPFDIVTATDVLPYLGFLEELFFGVSENLEAGGLYFFSSETLPTDVLGDRDFMVGPHQRFVHAESYVRKVLAAAGFDVVELTDITVRLENAEPIKGHLVVSRKK